MVYGTADNSNAGGIAQPVYYQAGQQPYYQTAQPTPMYYQPGTTKLSAPTYDTGKATEYEQQQYATHPAVRRKRHGMLILKLVLMAVVAGVVVAAFIFGIDNLDTTCNHPLAEWLIADASVKLSQLILIALYTVVTHFRTHVSTLAILGDEEPVKAATPMWYKVVNGIYLLFYVVWILGIGSWWVWTAKDADKCDTSLYEKARGVLITVYIVLGVVLLVKARGFCKRQQTA